MSVASRTTSSKPASRSLEVELTVLDTGYEIGPLVGIEREWFTGAVLAVPHDGSPLGQGRHFHTSPVAAPAARPEQQSGLVLNGHRFLLLVALVLLQHVCDELGGLISGQTLTYQ